MQKFKMFFRFFCEISRFVQNHKLNFLKHFSSQEHGQLNGVSCSHPTWRHSRCITRTGKVKSQLKRTLFSDVLESNWFWVIKCKNACGTQNVQFVWKKKRVAAIIFQLKRKFKREKKVDESKPSVSCKNCAVNETERCRTHCKREKKYFACFTYKHGRLSPFGSQCVNPIQSDVVRKFNKMIFRFVHSIYEHAENSWNNWKLPHEKSIFHWKKCN